MYLAYLCLILLEGALLTNGNNKDSLYGNWINPTASCKYVIKTPCRYVQMVGGKGSWPKAGFCRTLINKAVPGSAYTISVSLYNVQGWTRAGGHLGILYNAKDINNFDFVYFRPHSSGGCFQTGYVENGVPLFRGGLSKSCPNGPAPDQKWFTAKVEVRGKSVSIFKDGQLTVQITSHYPAAGKGGVLLANGYKNIIRFKRYRIRRL